MVKTFYAQIKCLNYKMLSITETRSWSLNNSDGKKEEAKNIQKQRMAKNLQSCVCVMESWQRRQYRDLQKIMGLALVKYFINGQRIQWLGHILIWEEITFWGLLSSGNSKKTTITPQKEMEDWQEIVYDREKWWDIIMTAKITSLLV